MYFYNSQEFFQHLEFNFPRLIFLFPSWHILHSRAKYQVQGNKDVQRLERKHFKQFYFSQQTFVNISWSELNDKQLIHIFVQIMITAALFILQQLNNFSSWS